MHQSDCAGTSCSKHPFVCPCFMCRPLFEYQCILFQIYVCSRSNIWYHIRVSWRISLLGRVKGLCRAFLGGSLPPPSPPPKKIGLHETAQMALVHRPTVNVFVFEYLQEMISPLLALMNQGVRDKLYHEEGLRATKILHTLIANRKVRQHYLWNSQPGVSRQPGNANINNYFNNFQEF